MPIPEVDNASLEASVGIAALGESRSEEVIGTTSGRGTSANSFLLWMPRPALGTWDASASFQRLQMLWPAFKALKRFGELSDLQNYRSSQIESKLGEARLG